MENLSYRKIDLSGERSILATESVVNMGSYQERLDFNGLTGNPQRLPFLDTHKRDSIRSVLGSFVDLRIENGQLTGIPEFSQSKLGQLAKQLKDEGHLPGLSIGYKVHKHEKADGIYVARAWELVEVSATVMPADKNAMLRNESEVNDSENRNNTIKEKNKMTDNVENENKQEAVPVVKPETIERMQPELAATPPVIDGEKILESERARVKSILATCNQFGLSDRAQSFVESGADVPSVKLAILEDIAKRYQAGASDRLAVSVGTDSADKYRSHVSDGIMLRLGLPIDEKLRDQANPYFSMTAMEMAKDVLKRSGHNLSGLDQMEIASRAMTSSDFANIINTTAYKTMKMGYSEKRYLWNQIASTGSVPNFLTQTEVAMSRGGVLDKMTGENSEYPFGYFTDGKETYKIDNYAKAWGFSRIMLINDQLNAIYSLQRMGETAARTIEHTFFTWLESNPTLGDGFALFSTQHSNIATGATIDPPSLATFNAAELAMNSHLDRDGVTKINTPAVFFMAGYTLKGFTSQFLSSPWWNDEVAPGTPDYSTATTRPNVWHNKLTEIYAAQLASTTAWYFLGPKGDHFEVAFLNGRQEPRVETQVNHMTKDLVVTVDLAFGVRIKEEGYKSVYYNAGT